MQIHRPDSANDTACDSRSVLLPYLSGQGLPDRRAEHWRMTPISRLYDRQYSVACSIIPSGDSIQKAVAYYTQLWSVAAGRLLVFYDSVWLSEFSDSTVLVEYTGKLPKTDYARLPFMAQNHALDNTAYHADIEETLGEDALHILCLSSGTVGQASFGKLLVTLNPGLQATIVESHMAIQRSSGDDFAHYVNQSVQIDVKSNAQLNHYKWQDLPENVLHIAANQVQVADHARYDGFILHLGGLWVRQDQEINIIGSHAHAAINGAYIASTIQHIDNTSQIQHVAPESYSREVFKGVLADKAKGVFQARIHVHQLAQLTDAYQMNRALLLSPLAEINAKPELEIYADDVKCSHGATVGALDSHQLFYLMARGIPRTHATTMLIEAYLDDVFADIEDKSVAKILQELARQRLQKITGAIADKATIGKAQ